VACLSLRSVPIDYVSYRYRLDTIKTCPPAEACGKLARCVTRLRLVRGRSDGRLIKL